MSRSSLVSRKASAFLIPLLLLAGAPAADAAGPSFRDVAAEPESGLTYHRVPSPRKALFDALKRQPVYTFADLPATPMKVFGAPGVALLDFDVDGDLDVFVTNGPGAANSLFANQLADTGALRFVDVAEAAGVAAPEDDANGVCFGDMDNDGDPDLLVLTHDGPGRLFENRGDGTFRDTTGTSGLTAGGVASACATGDVDGDGLLDIAIAYTYDDWSHQLPYFGEPFAHNRPTRLYLNQGGNRFADGSAAAGVDRYAGLEPGTALVSWAIALVDHDQDGDLDLFLADDQTIVPQARRGGLDLGLVRLFENDGTGHFEDVSAAAGSDRFGAWMGLAFGDLDCDGQLDLFASNLGDYTNLLLLDPAAPPGEWASRWLLANGDGTFRDPGVGDLVTTPFGWGATIQDFDNDGDDDIAYHGGFDLPILVDATNPGTLLANQGCSASFAFDDQAFAGSTNHTRRTVHGLAAGDLDGDGAVDLVSVSSFDVPPEVPVFPYPFALSPAFDPVAGFTPNFFPGENPGEFVWTGFEFAPGSLSVEINGGTGGGWLQVNPLGTVGLTSRGAVNRDGIGAVVRLLGERPRVRAVLGGSSHGSQDEPVAHFGLGSAPSATVEVLWPGGVRNRLYDVGSGERVRFPEIPCSFDGDWESSGAHARCVSESLAELRQAGVVSGAESARFFRSAVRAFQEGR